ncbi:hypothetical protein MTX26_01745 [Bradyrhizobium sp. ISRA443]|uniref:hypothetical protein n=1 Tax=unclassified Bradyrhizobium TaxID=2631580 RepID=UPI002478E9AC|nr:MULTISPECIES: hypothetical protein [unclassified Bradyrhizobium]WGR94793.1 hypothetical protein MTX20_11785 [Bradyrhizobium sp. ISRA435]WGR99622.1 hypothetical protein MTX23_01745 [Bradyrhizobium sp. ISRA436]WGS06512.1 hypothetical protein MTX18_01745 [Bradyrhizobium sp. ISRA437]WGS13396.1 hypothetical protein MTX26_01745 [Bradyrhizobium sp. ISRA443]
MARLSLTRLLIEREVQKIAPRLQSHVPLAAFADDIEHAVGDAVASARTDEDAVARIKEAIDARSHLIRTSTAVDPSLARQAFGERPSLYAQGRIVREYGEDAAKEIAADWQTQLGSLNPGKDPTAKPPAGNVKRERGRPADIRNNPWSKEWKGQERDRADAKAHALRVYGIKKCEQLSAEAGVHLLSGRPR